jgi:hypothetical protein
MRILPDEILIQFDRPRIRGDNSLLPAVAGCVTQALLDEVCHRTGEIALAVAKFRREFGNRVAALNDGKDFKFNAPEHVVT